MEIKSEMETKHDCCKHEYKKGSNMKMYIMVVMVVSVLLVSVVQSFQIKSLKGGISGNVVQSSGNVVQSGGIDMSGWTDDEKMQYEHHGTLPARLQQSSNQQNMVGGC